VHGLELKHDLDFMNMYTKMKFLRKRFNRVDRYTDRQRDRQTRLNA